MSEFTIEPRPFGAPTPLPDHVHAFGWFPVTDWRDVLERIQQRLPIVDLRIIQSIIRTETIGVNQLALVRSEDEYGYSEFSWVEYSDVHLKLVRSCTCVMDDAHFDPHTNWVA